MYARVLNFSKFEEFVISLILNSKVLDIRYFSSSSKCSNSPKDQNLCFKFYPDTEFSNKSFCSLDQDDLNKSCGEREKGWC